MQRDDGLVGDEFDSWMGGKPGGSPAADPADRRSKPAEPLSAEPGSDGDKAARYKKLMKPGVIVPVVLCVGVIGLMLVRGGGEPAPVVGEQYAQLASIDLSAGAASDQSPAAAPDAQGLILPADVAGDPLSAPQVQDATMTARPQTAPPQTEVTAGMPAPAAPVEVVEPAPAQTPVTAPAAAVATAVPAAEAVPAATPAAPQDNSAELQRRINALENDVDRAQQNRSADRRRIQRLERELADAKAKQGAFTVVAVLSDGVVVRGGNGAERVYSVGTRIEP